MPSRAGVSILRQPPFLHFHLCRICFGFRISDSEFFPVITFILRRFASLIGVLFCVITITFFLVRIAPGGPFVKERSIPPAIEKQLQQRFNLDGSLWEQYTTYLGVRRNATGHYSGLLQGDLQPSLKYRDRSVREILGGSLPISIALGIVAFLIATTAGIWLGSLAAVRHHTAIDTTAMLGALALISIPTFVTGPVLILFFSLKLGWLPVGGWVSWKNLILPAIDSLGDQQPALK